MMMRLTLGTTFLPSFSWELPVPLGGTNLSCFPLWKKNRHFNDNGENPLPYWRGREDFPENSQVLEPSTGLEV